MHFNNRINIEIKTTATTRGGSRDLEKEGTSMSVTMAG